MATKKKVSDGVPADEEIVNMSLRLPRSLHERLRKLNFDTREPMHSIAIRGIEMVLRAEKH
jgi:hypothetical protein